MSDIHLDILDAMTATERRAFLGWFAGAFSQVMYVPSRPTRGVVFGKHECEQVDFKKFWLGRMVETGLFELTVETSGKAKGMEGHPEYFIYNIRATDLGWDTRDAYFNERDQGEK